jgi:molecular chaperone GrpE
VVQIPKENSKNEEEPIQESKEENAIEKQEKEEQNYAELREQLLRLAAEFDNYKKKAKKDIEYSEKLGKASLMKSLLPIIDEFELAMLAINDSKDKNVGKGIEMLYSNLIGTLKKDGLSEIDASGIFDPYRQEIIMTKESEEKEGTILEVVKKGYMFGDKLLRPASVIIAKKEEKNENKEEKTE